MIFATLFRLTSDCLRLSRWAFAVRAFMKLRKRSGRLRVLQHEELIPCTQDWPCAWGAVSGHDMRSRANRLWQSDDSEQGVRSFASKPFSFCPNCARWTTVRRPGTADCHPP